MREKELAGDVVIKKLQAYANVHASERNELLSLL